MLNGQVSYVPAGGEFTVNSTIARTQIENDVTLLANGNIVVAWRDMQIGTSANQWLRAQIYAPDGTAVGGEITLGNRGWEPSLTGLAGGGFAVVWNSGGLIEAQVFDDAGLAVGPAVAVAASTANASLGFGFDVASLADGGFAVTWDDTRTSGGDTSGSGIRSRSFDSIGAATGESIQVNVATYRNQGDASIAGLPGGGYVVTWNDTGTSTWTVKARLYGADGAALGGELIVSNSGAVEPQVVALAGGGFAIAWTGPGSDTYVQLYSAAGVSIGAPTVIDGGLSGTQVGPALAALPNGGLAVAYTGNYGEYGDGSGSAVFVQAIGPDGETSGPALLANSQTNGNQYDPSLAAFADGTLLVTWSDRNGDQPDDDDVKAQLFTPQFTVGIISGHGATGAVEVDEGVLAVTTVAAANGDGAPITYGIAGGADAALFAIDAATGALRFLAAKDYEAPQSAAGNNRYDVIVSASDGVTSDSQAIAVTVVNVNEAPVITSNGGAGLVNATVNENSSTIATVAATDVDGDAVSFAIAGGADAARFTVDTRTGALSFISAPDFEAPTDADRDNVYDVVVNASDGRLGSTQAFAVRVADLVDTIKITSGGAGDTASAWVGENGTAVTTVAAISPTGGTPQFAITGGTDAASFAIDTQTGALRFLAAPDYEAPTDADRNNSYKVMVSVSDGSSTDTQELSIQVTDLDEAPVIAGGPAIAVSTWENRNAVISRISASDPEGRIISYNIVGGPDQDKFAMLSSTGEFGFRTPADFEARADANGDNIYEIVVAATDGWMQSIQTVSIKLINVNEGPVITSNGGGDTASLTVKENTLQVAAVTSNDPDGDTLTYAIVGGSDASRFAIASDTGLLTFKTAPSYAAPGDSNADNVYQVVVRAFDAEGLSDLQTLSVKVVEDGVNKAPTFSTSTYSLSSPENATPGYQLRATDPEGAELTYTIVGGADAGRFTLTATGVLRFVAAPDYEAPTDANRDNRYEVKVSASDGFASATQTVLWGVSNVAGKVYSGGSGADTVNGTDEDDTLRGMAGSDRLYGLDGDDILDGGTQNDFLYGGAGADRLTGGTGADQFVLEDISDSTVAAPDWISDFNQSEGDRISLSAIDANTTMAGNQAFAFIGGSAFNNTAGELRTYKADSSTYISGDVDGDGIGDLLIRLTGSVALTPSSFML